LTKIILKKNTKKEEDNFGKKSKNKHEKKHVRKVKANSQPAQYLKKNRQR